MHTHHSTLPLPLAASVAPEAIDHGALRAEAAATVAAIRALKSALRRTWRSPMAAVQRRLLVLQQDATVACVLRAGLRGRLHLADTDDALWEAAAALAARHRRAPIEVQHGLG